MSRLYTAGDAKGWLLVSMMIAKIVEKSMILEVKCREKTGHINIYISRMYGIVLSTILPR